MSSPRLVSAMARCFMGKAFIAVPPAYASVCLCAVTVYASAGELSQSQRDAVLKGSFHMCVETAPRQMTEKFGTLAVKRFCSCYADEIANNMTRNQFDSMVIDPKTGQSKTPLGYQATVANANRVCSPELTAK